MGQDIKESLDQFLILQYLLMVLRCIEPAISNYVFNEFLVILIVCHVWDLEPSGTVPFIGLKLNPQLLRSGGEGDGAFVGLAGFICCHRIGRRGFPHHQVVSTVVLYGQEDLRDHNQDAALGGWVDGPRTLSVGRVIAWVVRGFNVSGEISQLPSTSSVFTLGYVCGAIKVSHSISWARNTTIFSKFRLICSCRATNTSVSGGVVEMSRGTLNSGFTFLEGSGSQVFGGEASSTGEAGSTAGFRLECAQGTGLAGCKAIRRVFTRLAQTSTVRRIPSFWGLQGPRIVWSWARFTCDLSFLILEGSIWT